MEAVDYASLILVAFNRVLQNGCVNRRGIEKGYGMFACKQSILFFHHFFCLDPGYAHIVFQQPVKPDDIIVLSLMRMARVIADSVLVCLARLTVVMIATCWQSAIHAGGMLTVLGHDGVYNARFMLGLRFR